MSNLMRQMNEKLKNVTSSRDESLCRESRSMSMDLTKSLESYTSRFELNSVEDVIHDQILAL